MALRDIPPCKAPVRPFQSLARVQQHHDLLRLWLAGRLPVREKVKDRDAHSSFKSVGYVMFCGATVASMISLPCGGGTGATTDAVPAGVATTCSSFSEMLSGGSGSLAEGSSGS